MTGKELKAIRLKLKHSQATLAKAVGVSTRQVIRYEKGVTEIPQMLVMALRTVPSRR